jgi:hypothetical protein
MNMWKKLRFKLVCTLALLGFMGTVSLNAQVSDATGTFDPALTGDADVVYAAVVYNDVDNDGNLDALFAVAGMPILGWGDYSANVIFYADGIVVENGTVTPEKPKFGKNASAIMPVPGQLYHIWMVINNTAQTYKVWVQTEGLPQAVLVWDEDAAFVNKTVTSLTNWAAIHNGSGEPDYLTVQKVSTTYAVGQLPAELADATLKSLTVSIGTLVPEFNPTTFEYELEVPYGTPSVTISAVANGVGASLSGTGTIPLEDGAAYATIIVTAGNGEQKEYSVMISEAGGASDASLKSIGVSAGALDPLFGRDVLTYKVIVPVGTASVDVTAMPTFGRATITGTGNYVLSNGVATAVLNVKSDDQGTTSVYTVNIEEADGNNYAISLSGGNGTTSNIDISGLGLSTLPFTVEMWVKPIGAQPENAGLFFNRNGTNNAGLQYTSNWQTGGRLRAMTNIDAANYGVLSDAVITDVWHHVAMVVSETNRKVYLDGVEVSEDIASPAYDFASGKLYLGYDNGGATRAFKGYMDEVRVWNVAKTAQELTDSKLAILTGTEANLVAYWNFELKNMVQAVNAKTGGLNGLIKGGTYVPSFPRADVNLSALSVSIGTLMPDFNANVNVYHVVLPKGTTSFDIAAVASDAAATVTGTGTVSVTGNLGQAIVTVKSADSKYTNDYVINYKVEVDLTLKHQYTFSDGTANDNVGNAHGTINGGVVADGFYTTTTNGQHISLPGSTIAINTYPSITLELYVKTPLQNDGNRMISYFGNTGSNTFGNDYLFTSHKSRAAISCGDYGGPWNAETGVSGTLLEDDGNHHLVCTLTNDEIGWYIDGVSAGKVALPAANKIHNLSNVFAYICKSGYNDKTWLGSVNEYNIYAGIMDDVTIALRATQTPTKVQGASSKSITVFPTKSNGNFTVTGDGMETSVTVVDMTGKTVARQVSAAASQTLNINKAGIYVLKIESGSQVKMVKVIVTK